MQSRCFNHGAYSLLQYNATCEWEGSRRRWLLQTKQPEKQAPIRGSRLEARRRGAAGKAWLVFRPKHPHTTLILVTFTSISAEMCESTAQFDFRDSLEPNWRYSADEIARSPSVQSGMSADEELYLQWSCCKYIEDVASRLVGEKYPFTYC